jgi:hypothetical protein
MPLRELPKIVYGVQGTVSYTSSPAGTYRSSTDINGAVIDRLALGREYNGCMPFGTGSGAASTEADAKVTMGIKLQHGDSSGGGDMADFSTQSTPTDAVFGTSAQTTPMDLWTTGAMSVFTRSGVYDLRAAKRYIRPVLTPTIEFNATSTTASGNLLNVHTGVCLLEADEQPDRLPTVGVGTTSTST